MFKGAFLPCLLMLLSACVETILKKRGVTIAAATIATYMERGLS